MTNQEAIERMKYRINTATDIVGKGVDGNAYEDMELAIQALEKQIPMKPEYDKGTNTLNCPVCGDYLQHFVGDDSLNGAIPHYCNNCGQKIKEDLQAE